MMRSSGMARRRNSILVRATLLTWVVLATMDRPDSGGMVCRGSLTFGVEDSTVNPPPPPPPPVYPLVSMTTTDAWPPTPTVRMALIVGGYTPFDCPVVSAASVIDTSHLA